MLETSTGVAAEYLKVDFPVLKGEQEKLIVEGFLKSPPISEYRFLAFEGTSAEQNPENDFDFTLRSRNGNISHLELTECAPFGKGTAGYSNAPSVHNSYDFASGLMNQMIGKSTKYGSSPKGGLSLLVYETDWKFMPSQKALALLRYWSLTRRHIFAAIFWYHPIELSKGISELIFPTPTNRWADFSPDKYRDSVVTNLSPTGWISGTRP